MEALRGIVEDIWHYETAFRGQVPPLPHTRALPFPPASLPEHVCKNSPVFAGCVIRLVSEADGAPPGRDGSTGSGITQRYHTPVSL